VSSLAPRSLVSAVVVSFNTREDTLRCLRSLRPQIGLPGRIFVVDNASQDGSADAIRTGSPEVVLLALDTNLGYGAANNRALVRVQTPYVLFLNSDAELRPGAVEALVRYLEADPAVGLVGPRTLNSDGTPQVSWGPRLTLFSEWRHRRWRRAVAAGKAWARDRLATLVQHTHAPAWLSGSCLLARVESLRQVGFFDEGYFLYEEDADLCLRLRQAQWALAFVPGAEVVHHSGRSAAVAPSSARLAYHRSHLRYYALHNGVAQTALLRGWLLIRAAIGWLLARGRTADAAATRRHWGAVARMALVRTQQRPAGH
jgi:N-acetylglucosaminyl-diphospho-decaprenol L-rhamnosyltransferase